jgi:ribonuclease J
MRVRIHRGAREIGGNCVEIESKSCSILLDLGLPLTADAADPSLLPHVSGLTDGSNPHLLGIILSHAHGDHYGLTGFVHRTVRIFMGVQAQTRPDRQPALHPSVPIAANNRNLSQPTAL